MRRRSFLALVAGAPLAIMAACRAEPAKAEASGDLGDPSVVGSRAWYIQRLYDSAAAGNDICTRDNGALFEFCLDAHSRNLMGPPRAYVSEGTEPVSWRRYITHTSLYIYWPMPRRAADRAQVLARLKEAAARDESFARLPAHAGRVFA